MDNKTSEQQYMKTAAEYLNSYFDEQAMKLYAKDKAIAFTEWMLNNVERGVNKKGDKAWITDYFNLNRKEHTSQQLYELFLKQQS